MDTVIIIAGVAFLAVLCRKELRKLIRRKR